MIALKTFAALSTLALLAACAGPRGPHGMAGMEHMHSTHAKTPEERQALMAEHMKAMDCGMTAPPVR